MPKPRLKNYTTKVPAERTASEIGAMLVKHGASKIMQEYDGGNMVGVSWMIATPHGEIAFRMPVDVGRCHRLLVEQGAVKPDNFAQSCRVAWRIIRDWVDVQLALIATEMVSLEQVMLPYMVGRDDRTLYEHMVDGGFSQFAALTDGSS